MGGRVVAGDAGRAFDSVSIDTRTLTPGALYIGIRGERFDGADFAARAIEAGAGGVVLPERSAKPLGERAGAMAERAGGEGAVVIACEAAAIDVDQNP